MNLGLKARRHSMTQPKRAITREIKTRRAKRPGR